MSILPTSPCLIMFFDTLLLLAPSEKRIFFYEWQGVGGIVELAPGYLPAAYSSIKKAGGLCIADEVQSGFGRTGSHFWGFESQGVVPDIVTMAKVGVLFVLFSHRNMLKDPFSFLFLRIDSPVSA